MKVKIKKTGENVNIISYNDISTTRTSKYLVSYIDSQGVEHGKEGTDYHLDFESIDNFEHWQDIRKQAAIAAMQGVMNFFGSIDYNRDTIAKLAVEQADALIEQLKKK